MLVVVVLSAGMYGAGFCWSRWRVGDSLCFLFFFSSRRRHTRCSRDWSSDVCSSDLSGALGRFSRSIFVWLLDKAFGVGAPTAVSATGGSLVERGPNQRAPVCRIGSRNHQAASAATRTMARQPSRTRPLRQPFTVSRVIHRTTGLERALHQIQRLDDERLRELQGAERSLQPREIARPGLPARATEREVGAERARLGGKAERLEFLFDPVLQDFQRRLRGDAHPDHPWAREIGKYTKAAEGEGEGARTRGGAFQSGGELRSALVRHVAKKLERHVDALRAHPLHR